jgi:hypothetical protein
MAATKVPALDPVGAVGRVEPPAPNTEATGTRRTGETDAAHNRSFGCVPTVAPSNLVWNEVVAEIPVDNEYAPLASVMVVAIAPPPISTSEIRCPARHRARPASLPAIVIVSPART